MSMTHPRIRAANCTVPAEAGIQTQWMISRATDPVELETRLRQLGITNRVVRNRTASASLKLALMDQFPYKLSGNSINRAIRQLPLCGALPPYFRQIRALQNKAVNGYGVFVELRIPNGTRNDYPMLCGARHKDGSVTNWSDKGLDLDIYNVLDRVELQQRFDHYKSTLGAEEIGEMLTRILESLPFTFRLGLRKGRWHVPKEQADLWCEVAAAVEECNVDSSGKSIVEIQPMVFTPSSLEACKESICGDIQRRCDTIMKDISAGMGQNMAINRTVQAAKMAIEIEHAEKLLGDFDADLSSMVKDVEVAISSAMATDSSLAIDF